MNSINSRLQKLESAQGDRMSLSQIAAGVNRVLETPHLVSPQAYSRIIEILENCKQRQAESELRKAQG